MSVKIEFEVSDIISKEELEEKAKEILIETLRHKIEKESERLLGNAAYYCAHQIMDGLITESEKAFIQSKTLGIIERMDKHDVFRMKDWYGRDHSVGFYEIENTVRDNREVIIDKTKKIIENFDYEQHLQDECIEILKDAIIKKLEKVTEK